MTANLSVKNVQGFSVIELIVVIILLGIIAVTAGPAFMSRDGIAEQRVQTELLSLLRLSQERAMQDVKQRCYGITISAAELQPYTCGETITNAEKIPLAAEVTVTVTASLANAQARWLFNSWGCPVSENHSSVAEPCGQSSVEFTINGATTRYVCVQSHGYIRSGACSA
ncbi:prepilin-type N-terminal cleavage/methylation domain-containing protein [Pseudidiomarina sp. CB1]|uniref:prepilin-type N-terminal cleavage/methylation domain-containing protein n=1 Tax=Pseudidiomarina sp. CB1 TaxID=2972484 RepID=UPI0021618CA1|nr:prepilin-type N-terminal cleavage/methylation domain-containing protein [Pseudidiomarina sp. CB1]